MPMHTTEGGSAERPPTQVLKMRRQKGEPSAMRCPSARPILVSTLPHMTYTRPGSSWFRILGKGGRGRARGVELGKGLGVRKRDKGGFVMRWLGAR